MAPGQSAVSPPQDAASSLPEVLRLMLDAAPEALAVIDPDTAVVLAANTAFAAITGGETGSLVAAMRAADASAFSACLRVAAASADHPEPFETRLFGGGRVQHVRWRLRNAVIGDRTFTLLSAVPLLMTTADTLQLHSRLADLIDSAAMGVAVFNAAGIAYCSRAYAALFGFADPEAFRDAYASGQFALPLREGDGSVPMLEHFELRGMRQDGSEVWLDLSRRIITWSGEPAYLVTAYDISRRKKSEMLLNQSEMLFRKLINSAPALIAFIDRDGRYEFVNEQLANLLGMPAESLSGCLATEPISGRPYTVEPNALKMALAGQQVIFQSEIRSKSGRVLVFENHYRPRLDGTRNDGVFMLSFDVSDRVEAANALRASEERFRKLIELIPYGIARTDARGLLRLTNPAHDAMLGYEPGELEKRSIWELFVPEEQALQREIFFRSMREKPQPFPNVARCQRKDGRVIDVLFNWSYEYDENGEVSGFISVLTDVTDELIAKRELEIARDAAERAASEKSRFLAAASHDLQQPLHSLSIMLGLLAGQKNEQRRNEIIAMMERAVDGARALLRVVLDISKLEAGVVVPHIEAFPIADIFEQIEADLAPLTEGRPVQFRMVRSSAEVMSDRMLLKSILHNLVSNAIRYTPRGRILIGCRRQGDFLRIEVWDTGKGIPADRMKDIFKEFTRLEKGEGADQSDGQGLGLGLSIVERSCSLLGHKLAVRSEVGRGSVFSVAVPLVALRMPDPAIASASSGIYYKERSGLVLLVEDNQTAARATCQLIEEWGNRCHVALSTAEALAVIRSGEWRPDVVVADYDLGDDETGIALLDRLFAMVNRRIPAILMTANDSPECQEGARARNIPIIQKPANPARLRALLSYCLAEAELDGTKPGEGDPPQA